MSQRRVSREPKRRVITLTLPEDLLKILDDLADDVEEPRGIVIQTILEYGLEKIHLDEIFPLEEDDQGEQS